jgi:hypothetical protein
MPDTDPTGEQRARLARGLDVPPSVLGVTDAMLRNVAQAAHLARTAPAPPRPVCDAHEPLDGLPGSPELHCHLPAGHRSDEHYDRAFALAWRPVR